jgi:cysteine sulfinate desulfinase/cysteine desulfurase-like protein
MQTPEGTARGAIRLTLGRKNTEAEIGQAAEMIIGAYNELKNT